jgi:hypothetical protein
MSNLFEGAGIRASTGVQSPDGPSQTGLTIGVSDMNAPPPAAQKIKDLFAKYGIASTFYFKQRPIRGWIQYLYRIEGLVSIALSQLPASCEPEVALDSSHFRFIPGERTLVPARQVRFGPPDTNND